MKVLIISSRADFGGGPEHIYQLTKSTQKQPVSYVIACPNEKPYWGKFKSLPNVSLYAIPHRRLSLRHLLGMAYLVRTKKIGVIHSHGRGAGIYGRLLGLLVPIPIIHTFHGFHYNQLSRLKKLVYLGIEKILCRFTDILINVSLSEQASCRDAGLTIDKRFRVVVNGVNIPKEIPKLVRIDQPTKIVNISRLDKEKGVDNLVHIAFGLKERGLLFKLLLVGDGPEKYHLQKMTRDLGLNEYIEFTGFRCDVPDILSGADIYLTSSHGEGMPLSVLEAMSYSLPVIASDVTGNNELVSNGETGYLFPLDDISKAVDACQLLIEDPQLYQALSCNVFSLVSNNYSVRMMADKIYEVYEQKY